MPAGPCKTNFDIVSRLPRGGIGKPEGLKGNLSGFWSRRIDDTNRLVYAADNETQRIVSCRYHYGDK
ncbi:Txe/YoeB family addiction module toxin [Cupriavidus necator]|nr:Txe/YoeB family addiction module toxin [Cupriavidus necator]QQX88547.1 Txe/YoeB family addiction module toxin [Cupriavidus necator]